MFSFAILALAVLSAQQPPITGTGRVEETHITPRSKVVHGAGGRLVIPGPEDPAAPPEATQDPARAGGEREFHESVLGIRRSLHLSASKEGAILATFGRSFDQVPARALNLLRTADADTSHGALLVLRRYGGKEHAAELEYLLLTRSFGSSTDVAVDTLATLAQDEACDRLLSCLTASRAPVRYHAERVLGGRLAAEDADRLLALSKEAAGDVRIKTVRLLGFLPPTPAVRARLIAALSEDALVADAAVDALIAQGPASVADLQQILAQPALGRAFGYAAVALASLQDANPSAAVFTEEMREPLLAELDMPDAFQRTAVALALCDLAMRSSDVSGDLYNDHAVTGALVDVAAPTEFVQHISRLKGLSVPRLVRFTGRDFGTSTAMWRRWWEEMGAAPLVGARLRVTVAADDAAIASLTWRAGERVIVLRGEATAAPEIANVFDHFVTAAEMESLVAELRRSGFMGLARGEVRPREDRSLELRVGGALVRTDPQTPSAVLDRVGLRIAETARDQSWQLWRDAEREPDAAAFWRSELRWREQHGDPKEQAERKRRRLVDALARVDGPRRELAFAELVVIPELREILTEAEGVSILRAANAVDPWDAISFRLVELALVVPGEQVWRAAVDTAREHDDAASGSAAVLPRVFALLGPERLIASLQDASPTVRKVAMAEVGRLRDLRATPVLLAVASNPDEDIDLRVGAVQSLGSIRAPDAREPLLALLELEPGNPPLRRSIWVALGQVGGAGVFDVLRSAMATTDELDRTAIVRALGAMRQPEAAFVLAEIVALRKDDTLGSIALELLKRQGDHLASPALRRQVEAADPVVRGLSALALADFQDPAALPELFTMLDRDEGRLRVVAAIASIIGKDVASENARADSLRAWWIENRGRSQSEWFLQALDAAGVTSSLSREDLLTESGLAAIPELTRLTLVLETPHLRALAGRLLRVTTGVDYGTILPMMPEPQRLAICDRYRLLFESSRAASRR